MNGVVLSYGVAIYYKDGVKHNSDGLDVIKNIGKYEDFLEQNRMKHINDCYNKDEKYDGENLK